MRGVGSPPSTCLGKSPKKPEDSRREKAQEGRKEGRCGDSTTTETKDVLSYDTTASQDNTPVVVGKKNITQKNAALSAGPAAAAAAAMGEHSFPTTTLVQNKTIFPKGGFYRKSDK